MNASEIQGYQERAEAFLKDALKEEYHDTFKGYGSGARLRFEDGQWHGQLAGFEGHAATEREALDAAFGEILAKAKCHLDQLTAMRDRLVSALAKVEPPR